MENLKKSVRLSENQIDNLRMVLYYSEQIINDLENDAFIGDTEEEREEERTIKLEMIKNAIRDIMNYWHDISKK